MVCKRVDIKNVLCSKDLYMELSYNYIIIVAWKYLVLQKFQVFVLSLFTAVR